MSRTASLRATVIERRLKAAAKPARARALQRFFKTGPGEYGAGDRFLGLTLPEIRRFAAEFRSAPLGEIDKLLDSPWHEARLLALILLANGYRRADERQRERIFRLYLGRTKSINNWDLVDVTAPTIVGGHLAKRSRSVLRTLARSKSVWERRIAIIATLHFIRLGQFDDTLALAKRLFNDDHDLIHKAVGWALREVGKRDLPTLLAFLDDHAGSMPRTTLRYAIERLSEARRKRYLAVPKRVAGRRR